MKYQSYIPTQRGLLIAMDMGAANALAQYRKEITAQIQAMGLDPNSKVESGDFLQGFEFGVGWLLEQGPDMYKAMREDYVRYCSKSDAGE